MIACVDKGFWLSVAVGGRWWNWFMGFSGGVEGLSGGVFLDAGGDLALTQRRIDLELLVAAREWAVRNGPGSQGPSAEGRRGRVSMRHYGGQGTPQVASFAGAVFGARMGRSTHAGDAMIADALDLAHRLPMLWGRVRDGQVWASYARFVARKTRELEPDQAAAVDARVAEAADGRITWSRFEALVEAAVKAADPEAARAREEKARRHQFAKQTRVVTDGLGCFLIRADLATITLLDATVSYLAHALKELGVEGDADRLRVLTVAVLANPAQATQLLAAYTEWKKQAKTDEPEPAYAAGTDDPEDKSKDKPGEPTDADRVRKAIADLGARTGWTPDGTKPEVDWRSLLPQVQLFVHLYGGEHTAGHGFTRPFGTGLARVEGHGPATVTEAWLKEVLGPLAKFTVRPVLDLAGQAPVDAWEIPDRHRKAVRLITPADVFPFATATVNSPGGWSGMQVDHTDPYRWTPEGRPATPGQTRIGNYSPLTQFHHNLKTHGSWDLKQPYPGIYIWRDPHGGYYLVDHTGTQAIRTKKTVVDLFYAAAA